MATGFRKGATDFDDIFDPYVEGTKPANTGYTVAGYGDLANRYAPLSYGTKAANVGYSQPGVGDLSNLWAAKGTASYNLAINGGAFSATDVRAEAIIRFTMSSNGTYQITNQGNVVLASGYWLPSGDSVSNYTCLFTTSMTNRTDPGGAYTEVVTNASTQQALTTSRYMYGGAACILVSNPPEENRGYIKMSLYRLGVLKYTTTIDVSVLSSPF